MKACFIPENEEWCLVEADYAQLEFRLASVYGDVQTLIDAFNDPDRDVFQEIADSLGITRDEAKVMVYSIQYGAGARRISHVFNFTMAEAYNRINEYYLTYPGFKRVSGRYANIAASEMKVPLWSGRYRHFMFPGESHKAFNAVIQGGAADIVERTMLRCQAAGLNDGINSRMLLQVHDSIVFEVRKAVLPQIAPVISRCMEAVEPDFGVVFRSDLHYWGTKQKVLVAA